MVSAKRGETARAMGWHTIGAVAACALIACGVCLAQPAEDITSQMGIAVSGMGGARSALTLTYPSDLGPQKAAEDADALAEAGDWTIATPTRTEEGGSVYYEAEITPAVTLDATGRPPLFPFLHAFRRFPDITLVFVGVASGPAGDFTGANRFLSAEWHRSEGVTAYTIHIDDASFSSPEDISLTEAPLTEQRVAATAPRSGQGRPAWVLWLLLGVGSLGTGIFVWGLTWWGMSVRESRNGEKRKDKGPRVAKEILPVAAEPNESLPGRGDMS